MVIIVFISLLFLSAFFSGSETALLSLDKLKIKRMEETDPILSHRIVKLLSKPKGLFFTILAGNTLVNTAASACATMVCLSIFGSKGVGIAIGFMLVVLLLFGEVIPKTYAYLFSERFSKLSSFPLLIAVQLLAPIRNLLFVVTDNMINKLGFIAPKDSQEITEDEIKSLIAIGHREGVVEDQEKKMIYGVFEFKGQSVKDIMTPKIDMKALDFDMSQDEILAYTKKAKHSRLPIYRNSVDNIIGVIYAKDILLNPQGSLKDSMREAYIVPESKKIDNLLSDLQKRSIQLAIVKDEYGLTTGLVTMEDTLEEIVGEIVDEYDKEEPPIVKVSDKVYKVNGLLHINEANAELNLNINTEEVDTIGGFVSLTLQKIPQENEELIYGNHKFRVSKVERHRIKEIIITRI